MLSFNRKKCPASSIVPKTSPHGRKRARYNSADVLYKELEDNLKLYIQLLLKRDDYETKLSGQVTAYSANIDSKYCYKDFFEIAFPSLLEKFEATKESTQIVDEQTRALLETLQTSIHHAPLQGEVEFWKYADTSLNSKVPVKTHACMEEHQKLVRYFWDNYLTSCNEIIFLVAKLQKLTASFIGNCIQESQTSALFRQVHNATVYYQQQTISAPSSPAAISPRYKFRLS